MASVGDVMQDFSRKVSDHFFIYNTAQLAKALFLSLFSSIYEISSVGSKQIESHRYMCSLSSLGNWDVYCTL